MKTVLEIITQSESYLAQRPFIDSPRVDCEWLIAHALDLARMQLYLQFDRPLREDELAAIRPLLKRRSEGEPLQYITGSTEFYNSEILVGPGVLVPRPETERLVDIALEKYTGQGEVLDLCTGSGAILFALAKELPDSPKMIGVDISEAALDWAEKNLVALRPGQVEFRCGNLFEPVVGQTFALITANPPYVLDAEEEALPMDVRDHEPSQALFAGDGLDVIKRIAAGACEHLMPGGWLICEINEDLGQENQQILTDAGLDDVAIVKDYAKKDRIVVGCRPS